MSENALYLYALVRSARPPRVSGAPAGLPHTGPVRALDAGNGLWLLAADAPLTRYRAEAIERGLQDLDWVSACAVQHQQLIRHFARRLTTVPMRLFTLFRTEGRALAHVKAQGSRLARVLAEVEGCEEWGLRIFAESLPPKAAREAKPKGTDAGRRFLERKRAVQRAVQDLAASAPKAAESVARALAARARAERRLPLVSASGGSPLLVDQALLVPRAKSAAFRAAVARVARQHASKGLRVTLSGPWPAYNFVDEGPRS